MGRLLRFGLIGCGGLVMLVLLLGVAGALLGGGSDTASQDPGEPTAPEEPGEPEEESPEPDVEPAPEEPKPEPVSQPDPIELSGAGETATEAFELETGLTVVKLTHQGQENFAVTLLDENGEMVDLLANEIGSFEGATALGVTEGSYLLDVDAQGPWTATIRQPRPTDPPKTQSFQGEGARAPRPFSLPQGLARFELSHQGQENFAVTLLDGDGNMVDLLANEIGNFQGSTAVSIPQDGAYALDVDADGPWTIEVR